MQSHIDASTAEGDPLRLQSQSLFEGGVAAELDFPTCTYDSVPRQAKGRRVECPGHLACGTRGSCRPGDGPV